MHHRLMSVRLVCLWLLFLIRPGTLRATDEVELLKLENQVAWCIVPFDAAKRGPAERALMLKELGIRRCAYDWREEHVPTFEQEILEYQKQGIEFFAFWSVHEAAFQLFEKYDLHPQIWQILSEPAGETQAEKVELAAQQWLELAKRTQALGCKLGIYNHGGWGGEPENMVAVCQRLHQLGQTHVGIVYNFHHGHTHIENWARLMPLMQPYLICLNLNGMNPNEQPKILGIGQGAHELEMIRLVVDSGYTGPVGILDHREQLDARESLIENRDGLAWVGRELMTPGSGGPKPISPQPVPPQPSPRKPAQPKVDDTSGLGAGHLLPGIPGYRTPPLTVELPYDAEFVQRLVDGALLSGDAMRGAAVFASDKLACVSCHQVGEQGGKVGPALLPLAKDRELTHLVESLLWPEREVKPEYLTWQVLTVDGNLLNGYRVDESETTLTLREPSSGKLIAIPKEEIEQHRSGGSVMPAGMLAALTSQQQLDLIRFLSELGRYGDQRDTELEQAVAHSQIRGPAEFPLTTTPLAPERWQNSEHFVTRDRLYDFYTKQAEHFRGFHPMPMLLAPFPGLDGGKQGHWGNQNEAVWADGRWNETDLGSVLAGVFHADGRAIPRSVCIRLGAQGELAACFNPDTLTYEKVWAGGFVDFDSVRHGFVSGLRMQGQAVSIPEQPTPLTTFDYRGYYRHGQRIVFAYALDGVEYLDAPWCLDGEFVREVAPAAEHSLRQVITGGPAQWPQRIETKIQPGTGRPYAIDTIQLPYDNPWRAPMFVGDLDFFADGSALVCTMQGDVWHVTGLDAPHAQHGAARWRRFASGLHHPLGLVIADGDVYVQCRDQLTRLVDLNGDGEADLYECFSNAFETSPAGHDYICGLHRDELGNFYTASGNQGLLRISADGQRAEVLATGFRNPDGLGLLPDGSVTVPVSEGEWTPASAINVVRDASQRSAEPPLHFGYRGPRNNAPPELPLAYLPRGLDNSSGGQVFVSSPRFGPLAGQLLHFSFGAGAWFAVLRDEVAGQLQGAIVPLAGDFLSGVHRGRFNPVDGQLYVAGMAGWGSYTPDDGCFQRVRYTGDAVQLPTGFHVHENGVLIRFALPLEPAIAGDVDQQFAQCWNYRYSGAYGSVEYSTQHPGVAAHDPLLITGAHVLSDGHSLFLEIPDIQPVNQLHLRLHVDGEAAYSGSPVGSGHDLFLTIHRLDEPFTRFAGYQAHEKTIAAHPLLVDLANNAVRVDNPWRRTMEGARTILLQTGKNLTYVQAEFTVEAGQPLALTLKNPDVVPHNWVLTKPGALQRVGGMANELVAQPDAFARQYVPSSDDVLVHTDVVEPGAEQVIYFHAPGTPGRYPYLCTFPGHWMVMNGVMVVK